MISCTIGTFPKAVTKKPCEDRDKFMRTALSHRSKSLAMTGIHVIDV